MANSLTVIIDKTLARGLMALRETVIMPRLVNRDFETDAAQKNSTIDIPVPVSQTAANVTPSNTPPAPSDKTPTQVQLSLDQWKETNFHLTDKEIQTIDRDRHFIPMQMQEALRALSGAMNQHIHSLYTAIYGYVGTAGTTPFGSDTTDATNARKILNQQLCPKDRRRGVLDWDAEANALQQAPFADASQSTDRDVKIEGEIGRKYGLDWFADDDVATHTRGTLDADPLINNASVAIGDATVDMDAVSLAGTIVVGDIFTVAGDTQTYVVTAAQTASGNALTAVAFDPPAKVAWADDAQVTFKATHVVNLTFHRNAFAFASRPLVSSTADLAMGNIIRAANDPVSGISLRLEVSRQYKQTVWTFDALYGALLVRPELACRIAG